MFSAAYSLIISRTAGRAIIYDADTLFMNADNPVSVAVHAKYLKGVFRIFAAGHLPFFPARSRFRRPRRTTSPIFGIPDIHTVTPSLL